MDPTVGRALALISIAVSLAMTSSCSRRTQSAGPSALLITLDTTRWDAVSCYGVNPGVTPQLDRLAAEGVLFENAHTVAPITAPAHSSMLTGLYPVRHGVRSNGGLPLSEEADTLAELARRHGIETRAYISSSVMHLQFGLGQGFDWYESPSDPERRMDLELKARRAHDVVREAARWLTERDASRPFLLWVHLWDPHRPWKAEARFRQKGPYLSEVASVDDAVGQLIEALRSQDLLEQTTVLVVGDHGEGLGEHGEKTHGALCYQSTLRVPMILRLAGGAGGGRRETGIVSVVDVAPTLAEALGLPGLSGIDGQSLLHHPVDGDRGVYFESYFSHFSYGWSQLAGWVDAGGKYIFCSEPVFFDLNIDPNELAGRPAESVSSAARYVAAIEEIVARPALPPGSADAIGAEHRAAIESLGYVTSSSPQLERPGPLEHSDRLDPMRNVQLIRNLNAAVGCFGTGEIDLAESLLAGVVAKNPENYYALSLQGAALIMLKRHADAIEPLLLAVNNGQDSAVNLANLAIAYHAVGRDLEALPYFEQAYERNPQARTTLRHLANLHGKAGRPVEAARFAREYERLTGEKP